MKAAAIDSFLLRHQQRELNNAVLYEKTARVTKDQRDRETLLSIARYERKHVEAFSAQTGRELKPKRLWIAQHMLLRKLFGYTFMIQHVEHEVKRELDVYRGQVADIPELCSILEDEEVHEKKLADILDEERLRYAGDMVLGMNDALVELTGALAGYTFAMQNTKVIAMAGLITGISATLSMTASGYLSSREVANKNAVKSCGYTGLAYLITVALLIAPFLIAPMGMHYAALGATIGIAVLIIATFNYYLSVAKGRSFKRSFFTMAAISLGVAAISFVVGLVVKNALGIEL